MSAEQKNREMKLENIPLSVPFLILSTEMNINGQMQQHVLTPFGFIDIVLPANSEGNDDPSFPLEIKVIGDIDSWMLDELMPGEFRKTLLKFIKQIVYPYVEASLLDSQQTSICFESTHCGVSVRYACG